MDAQNLVIGIGNEWRGDDAVGIITARLLARAGLPGVRILEASGEGAALLDLWQGASTAILIDAVQPGEESGTIHRFDVQTAPLPTSLLVSSSHAFGVAQAIELGRALGGLPPRLIFYGIEVQDMTAGRSLSPQVEQASRQVCERIRQEFTPSG
jgi:hydrogenase maturation protease